MPALHPVVQDFQFRYNCFPKPYYSSTIFLGLYLGSIIFCHYFCGEQISLTSIQTGETHKAFCQSVFLCSSLFLYAFGCFIRNIGVTCYRFVPNFFGFRRSGRVNLRAPRLVRDLQEISFFRPNPIVEHWSILWETNPQTNQTYPWGCFVPFLRKICMDS